MRMRLVLAVVALGAALVGCRDRSGSDDGAKLESASVAAVPTAAASASPASPGTNVGSTPVPGIPQVDYGSDANWLCRPGRSEELCEQTRRAQVLAKGLEGWEMSTRAVPQRPVDCFYVYPTVSSDPGVNSDLVPGASELGVAVAQAAPFASACRVFAPMYRQLTLTALGSGRFNDSVGVATAYGDVVAAWEYYLEHDNGGRKVVLIGHSQGASVLKRLIQEHIDGDATARDRVAAAFLLGTAVSVPTGSDVGGDFKNIPACRSAAQQGCVIAYSSFNEASPPPPLSLFGRVAGSRNEALCVNPADLSGGDLVAWLTNASFRLSTRSGKAAAVTTDADYVVYSGLISSRCVRDGSFSYLSVAVNDEGKAWGVSLPPYITGEVWGLHNLDVTLSVGNLVALVAGYGK